MSRHDGDARRVYDAPVRDGDGVPWAWRLGLLLLVPTTLVLIYLGVRAGFGPRSDPATDEDELERAMRGSEPIDFAALPRDLTTLDRRSETAHRWHGYHVCGDVDLSEMAGEWRPAAGYERWADARVFDGRFQAGTLPRMELCPVHVVERSPGRILAIAVWHEDVDDPGDAILTYVELRRRGRSLEVRYDPNRDAMSGPPVAVFEPR